MKKIAITRGITVPDLLLASFVMLLVVGLVAHSYTVMVNKNRQTRARKELDEISKMLIQYNSGTRRKAESLYDLEGTYFTTVPLDPWKLEYCLDCLGGKLISSGADSLIGTSDDIIVSYLPEPAVTNIRFMDVGTTPVCIPDRYGIISFTNRYEPQVAKNEGRAGPGDIIEITFSRPVTAHGCSPLPHLERTMRNSVGDIVGRAWINLTGHVSESDFVFTDAAVKESDDDFNRHMVRDAAFHVNWGEYASVIYVPEDEYNTVRIILGDCSANNPETGFYTTITPGAIYMNLSVQNRFTDFSGERFLPAQLPILLGK